MLYIYVIDEYDPAITIVVEGIPPDLDADDLDLYFESNKDSGGGNTSAIQYSRASRRAIIIFDDPTSKSIIIICLSTKS